MSGQNLLNDCELCCDEIPITEMITFISCEHGYCKTCMLAFLQEIIETKYPWKWNCPFCPDDYYINVDKNLHYAQIREIISGNEILVNIFESKVLQECIMESPNFHWCANDEVSKRMIITELDFHSSESLKVLMEYLNDHELGEYLKEACLYGNVKLKYLKQAIEENFTISSTLEFLKKNCPMCADDYPIPEMIDLMACEHSFCKECMIGWLSETVESKYPCKWNCPVCPYDKYQGIDKNMYYNQLKRILDSDKNLISIFDSKLLLEHLMKSDHFHWCANEECTNGFEAEGIEKITCPSCKTSMCVKCNRKWQEAHENKSCNEFELWMLKNDPNLSKLLEEIGIECPSCKMQYSLAAGGSLHLDCKACGTKFCPGCYQLYVNKCDKPKCKMTNFHGHHPRNCLYFLRDYSVNELENMLKNSGYPQLQEKPEKKCQFMITNDRLKDVPCNREVCSTTGLCENHYKEYLVQFINRYKIDPADFVDSVDLNLMLFQMVIDQLTKAKTENDAQFKERLKKTVKESCLFYIPKRLIAEEQPVN